MFRNAYEHKRHNSEQHLMHFRMVFGGKIWVLAVTAQKCVISGLDPFKKDLPEFP